VRQKGFPRVGPPTEIVQVPNEIVFLYDTVNSSEQNAFRRDLDGWPGHDGTLNPSYYGDSIGHWKAIRWSSNVTNFVDDTWLSQNGTIHSDAMHVVEKLTREGYMIDCKSQLEDPKMFTRPWVIERHLIHGLKGGHALEKPPAWSTTMDTVVNDDRN